MVTTLKWRGFLRRAPTTREARTSWLGRRRRWRACCPAGGGGRGGCTLCLTSAICHLQRHSRGRDAPETPPRHFRDMSPGQVRLAPRGRDEEGQAGGGATPHSRASTCPLHTARRCEPTCEQAAALPASNVLSLARPRKRPRRLEGEAEPPESPPQLIFASATVPGQGGPSAGAFAATVKSALFTASRRRCE